MNWKSKITYVQILSIAITVIGALQPSFPQWAEITSIIISILTVILRQLQGQEIKVGAKTIKL